MNRQILNNMDVSIDRRGKIRRRSFLRSLGAGMAGSAALSWADIVNASSRQMKKKGKACILLWMQGGPSQFETFSPKPDHRNGGETKAISTSVNGIQIAESLPSVANEMEDICLIRSMTSKEGSHPRASYLMHTGYVPTAAIKYPTIGANVAQQIGDMTAELPSFVHVGNSRFSNNAGFLGIDYDPFMIRNAKSVPDNTAITTDRKRFNRRLQLLKKVDNRFSRSGGGEKVVADHQKLYEQATDLVLSPKMKVFDIQKEPAKVREAYGDSQFGAGCLLARRLVESGVTFVEVSLGNWDTHQNNFDQCKTLCGQLDKGYSQLIRDLRDRGMLDDTLIVWMGEFGRTPRINARGGRDHFPRAFNVALAGGGVRGGQVIGETDPGGQAVLDKPVQVNDLFCSIFHSLDINPEHENFSSGRPIALVEEGEVVEEIFDSGF